MYRGAGLLLACFCAASAHVAIRASDEQTLARRLSAIEVILEQRGLVVTFAGDGTLDPSSIHEAEQWPPRLVIDLPGVVASVPEETRVDVGPVEGIRVAAHSQEPLVTRVVFDLMTPTSYRIERPVEMTQTLTVIFPWPTAPSAPLTGQEGGLDEQGQDAFASVRPRSSVWDGAQWIPARAVMTPGRSGFFRALVPASRLRNTVVAETPPGMSSVAPLEPAQRIGGSPDLYSSSSVSPPRQDDIELVGHEQLPVGRLVDPETLPVPAYLMVGNRNTREVNGARPTGTSSRFVRPAGLSSDDRPELQQIPAGTPGQYTGDPVSMDFQNAPLRAVLRTLAEISGLNIVIDPQVDGSVDVALTDVPWDQALDIILRANQLGYLVDGTVVRIAPLTVLAAEEDQRRALAEAQALSGELVVMTRTLSYARAEAMGDLLTQSVLSARGQVQTDPRTNTLIVTDLEDRLTAVQELLDTLDRAEPQVEIEARIVQAGQDFARSIGVQWGIAGRLAPDLGNTTPLTFPNRGGVSGRIGRQQGPGAGENPGDPRASDLEAAGTAVNLPAAAATSALGVTMGSVDGSLNLDVVISAAENDGSVRLLSHPRVTTQNNIQAEIIQGDQIPIQIVANNTVTVQFEDAALSLRVTPQITEADTVIMQIEIDNDFADFGREINWIPPIVTQRASTTVQVANGDTTVIGGIFESERSRLDNRVPGLHRIPLLGWLFKSGSERESTDELLIFLTPRVIR